jgi:hypothetical protein
MPLDKNLRVTYIRDPNNSERVLTIVRRLNKDNTVTFGTSVNKPTTWVARHESRNVKILGRVPGDNFSKKKGRDIAVARLNGVRGSVTLEIEEGSSPYLTILNYLIDDSDQKVARIAANELLYLTFLDSLMDDSGFIDDEDEYDDKNGN